MNFIHSEQYETAAFGHEGRPKDYPYIDEYDDLLFYIQRNQNINAVIYDVNLMHGNILNLNEPIKVNWLYYNPNGPTEKRELNFIQKKLAYGYTHEVINNDLIEFRFVSYDQMKFFVGKDKFSRFRVYSFFNGKQVMIKHIYIYSEDFGVFPQVKYAEFFGIDNNNGEHFYKKLILQ